MTRRGVLRILWLLCAAAAIVCPLPAFAQGVHVRTVEDRDHVTVMEFGGVYDRQPEANRTYEQEVRRAVAREFLRTHTDDYDFLVVFTRFDYSLGTDSDGAHVGGRYYGVKNDIAGIGLAPFDFSADFGSSSGQLQGFIDMGVLGRLGADPTDPRFEQTLSTLAHEMMHRWGSHVRFRAADGSFSSALLGRDDAHWSFLLNTHNSVHYGAEWRDNGNGTFTAVGRAMTFFSPLDLYLMGILDKSQVPPFVLIQNPSIPGGRLPEVGTTISGTPLTVTIGDIIAAEGERVPSATNAQKRFKMGFVFLVRPGEQAAGLELARINAIREAFSTRALILTGGKGLVEVYSEQPTGVIPPPLPLPSGPSNPRTTPVDLVQALDWILARQSVDGSFADSASTRVRDTSAVLDALREVPAVFTSHQRGLAWLSQLQEHLNVDMVSRRLLAIRPQYSAIDASFLASARNASGGWGLARGFQSDPLDTALALLASPAAPAPADLAYLVSVQNADGGWGVRPGSASSIQGTLAVLRLKDRLSDLTLQAAIDRGQTWLAAQQNADGGFGKGGSTVYETADAVLYLLHTAFPKPQIAVALDWLRFRQLADGSWNGSTYQTALALRALKVAEFPNLAVSAAGLSATPTAPIDGQIVQLRAMIANDGVQDVQDVVVSVFDGDPAQGGVPLAADVVIANLPALSQLPVTVEWNTTDKAGTHQLVVVVDRQGVVEEFNEADNVASLPLTVQPPPLEADLIVTQADLTFVPAMLQAIPQRQTVAAAVINVGQTAAPSVRVAVFEGDPSLGQRVGETIVSVPARGRVQAAVSFDVTGPGERRYYVVVDPNDEVAEADETNNTAFSTLLVQSTLDFEALGVAISETPTTMGRDITITAQVRNAGTTDAFAVPVRLFIDDPAGVIDLASRSVDLPAGGTATVTATWRTSRALSAAPVVAVLDPSGTFPENSETNNRASSPLTVSASTDANLHVAPGSLVVASPVDHGGSATVTVSIANTGAAPAAAVSVAFFSGLPSNGGTPIGDPQVIAGIPAGGTAVASIAWTPADPGEKLIMAVVDPANTVPEFDEADNSVFTTVIVRSRPDLVISAGAINFLPPFPREGETVVVTATVRNAGQQPAPARVRFFDGDPTRGGTLFGEQLVAAVPGLGQVQAQAAFEPAPAPARAIYVLVDPLDEVVEQDETNNAAFKTLGVQDSSFSVSNVYFSPNGDERQEFTELFFRFEQPQPVEAVVVYDRQRRAVRTLELGGVVTSADSVLWDGRNDAGRVVRDGAYDLTVVSVAGVDLGSARVVVDTDNLPVSEALGTKFLLDDNLSCSLPIDFGDSYVAAFVKLGWLPDDSGMISVFHTAAIIQSNRVDYSKNQVGVYHVSADGQTVTRLTPDSWAMHPPVADGTQINDARLSPDGRHVLVILQKYRHGTRQPELINGEELWVVNVDGSGLRKVGEAPGNAYVSAVTWAPSSAQVAFVVTFRNSFGNAIESRAYVSQADGSAQVMVQQVNEAAGTLYDIGWTPDAQRIVLAIEEPFPATSWIQRVYTAKPDGTDKRLMASASGFLYQTSELIWIANDRALVHDSLTLTPEGYFDFGSDGRQLYLVSTDGAVPRRVSEGGAIAELKRSPNGNAVVFAEALSAGGVYAAPEPMRLWLMDGAGAARAVYESGPTTNALGKLAWTSNGDRIVWVEELITRERTCFDQEIGNYPCPDTLQAIGSLDVADGQASVVPLEGTENASFDPIGLFPDGAAVLFEDEDERLLAAGVLDGRRTVLLDDPYANWSNAEFSASGKYLLYQSFRDSLDATRACWRGGQFADEYALSSLLNLTAQFGFVRERAQLTVRGTAEDRNFARYQLEFAPAEAPAAWSPIGAAGDVSVINDTLATWIPPAEGSFYVRLTAEDKAGNVKATRQRVTWGLTPTITNLNVAPRMFSPNGDGTRDSVTIDYLVLGPVNLTFQVFDAANTVVQTIAQSHPQAGPASIAWDGRTETGQFVADGVYRIHVLDYDFLVTADTTPPAVVLTLGSAFHTVPERVGCAGASCTVTPGPFVEVPFIELNGFVRDPHIGQWRLEVGTGVNPTEWQFVSEGAEDFPTRQPFAKFADALTVVNKRYRVTASDQAGNRTVVVSDFAPAELVLFAFDGAAVHTTRPAEQRLGSHTLSTAYTGRVPAHSLAVQYRLQGTTAWATAPPVPASDAGAGLAWDNSTLSGGKIYEVRVLSTDVNGAQLVSNVMLIRADVFKMLPFDRTHHLAPGVVTLSEPIISMTLVTAGTDADIGMYSTFSPTSATFTITPQYDRSIQPCASRSVPARFKAVGASGRVYYSNTEAVEQTGPPGAYSCPGQIGFEGALKLEIVSAEAQACGVPSPGQVRISALEEILIDPKLFVQTVPNGPMTQMPSLTATIDTRTMPEGRYNVRATGTLAVDGLPQATKTGFFIVDRTPGTSQITYPATNQAFCAQRVNGRTVVPIEALAEDPNFARFELDYGFGDNPQNWVTLPAQSLVSGGTLPQRGQVGTWDVTGLPRGTYSLRQRVYDAGGTLSCSTVTFYLPAPVEVRNARGDVRAISPNGDGRFDSATIRYELPDAGIITVAVYAVQDGQRSATPVRTLVAKQQQLAGTNSIVWDGSADAGVPVADGTYAVVIGGTDACGATAEGVVNVVVDTTAPVALITAPQPGGAVPVVAEVSGTATDLHFQSYRLEVGDSEAPVSWSTIASAAAPVTAGLLGTWTRPTAGGVYTLRLTVEDAVGNSRETRVTLTAAAASGLVEALVAAPALFSPNLDGRKDVTAVDYHVAAAARVRLQVLDGTHTPIRTLTESDAVADGRYTYEWDGKNDAGFAVPDGAYVVRLTATSTTDPSHTQTEQTAVVVDTTAPLVAAATPIEDGHVRGDVPVTGSATDANLQTYAVSYASQPDGVAVPVAEGRQSRTDYVFGSVGGLADGRYTLIIKATDAGENTSDRRVSFTVDNTAPQVFLTSPAAATVVGGQLPLVEIRGSAHDVHLRDWTLRVGAGAQPASWTTLASGTTAVAVDALLATWNAGGIADGVYTLSLSAVDRAGTTTDERLAITVDNTAPAARILAPAAGARVASGVEIRGDAADASFKSARLEFAPGTVASASQFTPLVELTQPVNGGLLFTWQTLPPDGAYVVRLRVEDQVGQVSTAVTPVTIDTEPPGAPANLTATLESRRNARLTWTASSAADLQGYHVYRDGTRVTAAPLTGLTHLDAELPEGGFRYVVKAVDESGLESAPSNEVSVQVDLTPPAARIQQPSHGGVVGGLVEVRGSAASVDDFKEYRLLAATGGAGGSFTLVRRSPAPVTAGVLGEIDTSSHAAGALVTIRLETEDLSGNVATDTVTVSVDNHAPAAPVLVSAVASGSNVTVTWQPSPDADLAGYLLYNNDLLANVRRLVTNTTPYLLSGTTFLDSGLPDGLQKYYAFAVDKAGNISQVSNTLTVTIETHAPRATIVQPAHNSKTEHAVVIVATSPDLDVAQVQFQMKAESATTWVNLGPPVTSAPFQATWDPAGLPYGNYNFRAIATDTNNNTDPAAPAITVTLRDLTPPPAVTSLTAAVNGGTVTLAWPAVTASDLGGYAVYRGAGSDPLVRITSTLVTGTSFTDPGVADGTYRYAVRAIDTSANESPESPSAPAVVYAPVIGVVAAACVSGEETAVSGLGATPGASVTLFRSTAAGSVVVATSVADGGGAFVFAHVPLVPGVNLLVAQATDAAGNISKASSVLPVTRSDVPGAPLDLAAAVNGFDVTLTWTADPNAAGFLLVRNGEPLTTVVDATENGTATASSRESSFFRPERAIDGNPLTSWIPAAADESPWWELAFANPILLSRVEMTWGAEDGIAADFDVERWDGASWVPMARIRGNVDAETVVTVDVPLFTTRLRISGPVRSEGAVQLAEVRAFRREVITGTSYQDLGLSDGRYTYALSALNACGLQGPAAQAVAAVGDVTPPSAPSGLAASVAESAVHLTWTGVSEPDAVGYHVYRRGSDGDWAKVSTGIVLSPAFVDAPVRNGSYLYRVVAVDAKGNESLPSNEAAAVVDVTPPAAPAAVSVAPVPAGGALDLSWEAVPGPIAGYQVFRSTTAGGPYSTVGGPLVALNLRDRPLVNGTRYFYVVRALDAAGNLGAPSAEGNGIPHDVQAPDAPVLLYPTDSPHPITVKAGVTTISGIAEPGSIVTLLSDGLALAQVPASAAATSDVLTVAGASTVSEYLPSESLLVTFTQEPGSLSSVLTFVDTMTGSRSTAPAAAGGNEPVFSPDGATVAYTGDGGIVLFDRATGTSRTIPQPNGVSYLSFSPDGRAIAFVLGAYPNYEIRVLDVMAGTSRTLVAEGDFLSTLAWAPNGRTLAFVDVGFDFVTMRLKLVDVESGSVSVIDDESFGDGASFAPDGRLAFTTRRSGHAAIWIRDPQTGTAAPVFADAAARQLAVFSLDGSSLAYVKPAGSANGVHVSDLAAGTETMLLADSSGARPLWTMDRGLLLIDFNEVRRVRPAGAFSFASVVVPQQHNVYSAVAADAADNVSTPAAPLTLLRSLTGLADLVTGDAAMLVHPRFPRVGDSVRVTAAVRNEGDAAASGVVVGFYHSSATGQLAPIGDRTIGALAPGQQSTVSIDWQPGALVGSQAVVVLVDPTDAIHETSERNNQAQATVVISENGAPTLSVAVDAPSYALGLPVPVEAEVTNPGAAADFVLDLRIEDPAGVLVTSLASVPLQGFGYDARRVRATWTPSGVVPGGYRARAVLRPALGSELSAQASFTLTGERHARARITSDRAAYQAGETAQLTAIVTNASTTSDLGPVTVTTTVVNGHGAEVFRSDVDVPLLLAGATVQLPQQWVAAVPGVYTASVAVRQDGDHLAAADVDFGVAGVARIEGRVAVNPAPVAARSEFVISAEVSNAGTLAAAGATLRLALLDVARQVVVRQFERSADVIPGTMVSWQVGTSASGLDVKSYSVLLQIVESGVLRTLASTSLSVVDRQAPIVVVSAPAPGLLTNADVTVSAIVSDDASGVAAVEIQFDGRPWLPMSVADAAAGRFGAVFVARPGTDGAHTFNVRAVDTAGNSESTSSQDANPAGGAFTIDLTPPVVTLSGVEDGGRHAAGVVPIVEAADAHLGTVSIHLNGSPFVSGTPLHVAGDYVIAVTASDGAGNVTSLAAAFSVTAGTEPPTAEPAAFTTAEDTPVAVTLTATDPDTAPGALIYEVTLPAHGTLSGTAPQLTYTPAANFHGEDSFTFTVGDGSQLSAPATVTITVTPVNDPPTAMAGTDANVVVGETVTLDGSASGDVDGDVIAYRWSVLSVPAGSTIDDLALAGATTPKPSFVPDVPGSYLLALVVDDGQAESAPDVVMIEAERPAGVPPNARAGADRQVLVGTAVALDGSASDDPDNGPLPLTFTWSFVSVPPSSAIGNGSIDGRFAALAGFVPDVAGEYVLSLTVFDGAAETTDIVLVVAAENTVPAASAGGDTVIDLGQRAVLDGSASVDPDGGPQPLSYSWSLVSLPPGSTLTNASIQGRNTAQASVTPDVGGVFVFALTVDDGAATSTDNVAVTVRSTYRATGGAYFYHDGYQEKVSLDVLEDASGIAAASWLNYYYVRLRIDLASTQITSFTVSGKTATISGDAKVNGAAGFKFVATVVDGAPDAFGISITRPNGTLLYEYSKAAEGGDLAVTSD